MVEGPGLIDCHLYRQTGRLILHLVNLTNPGAWRAPVHELIPVGPLRVRLQVPAGSAAGAARLLVAGGEVAVVTRDGWAAVAVPSIADHEVVIIEY